MSRGLQAGSSSTRNASRSSPCAPRIVHTSEIPALPPGDLGTKSCGTRPPLGAGGKWKDPVRLLLGSMFWGLQAGPSEQKWWPYLCSLVCQHCWRLAFSFGRRQKLDGSLIATGSLGPEGSRKAPPNLGIWVEVAVSSALSGLSAPHAPPPESPAFSSTGSGYRELWSLDSSSPSHNLNISIKYYGFCWVCPWQLV